MENLEARRRYDLDVALRCHLPNPDGVSLRCAANDRDVFSIGRDCGSPNIAAFAGAVTRRTFLTITFIERICSWHSHGIER